mmetsp:Transcript_70960/g.140860  ORF Transcript_70960/g.140860 Transcript_70960/m.140860 type:complete len:124 (+) Transcript_70960:204-575(+)
MISVTGDAAPHLTEILSAEICTIIDCRNQHRNHHPRNYVVSPVPSIALPNTILVQRVPHFSKTDSLLQFTVAQNPRSGHQLRKEEEHPPTATGSASRPPAVPPAVYHRSLQGEQPPANGQGSK